MSSTVNRREAIALGIASLAGTSLLHAEENKVVAKQPICVFTKPFNSLSFDELADRIAELGFDGIEAPIRPGGNIEPEKVADELPRLVEALAERNLKITVMTSDINDPDSALNEKVLSVASDLGIKRYRMKYFNYDLKRSIEEQLKEWHPKFVDLAAMNKELGITAVYQNHAGSKNLGAALWDLPFVLKGISPEEIGVAYDIRHASVEGGMSWPITFQRVLPHLNTVYVKDAKWEGKKAVNVPLGEGIVDPKFFKMLKAAKFEGPISLHEEYLDHRKPELVEEHLQAIKKDFEILNNWLSNA
ncbi:MAG: sugar phosphate isomerase/epimerase [Planctomicrobium sp.]|jgi:sugar phosphate isomerase/epimerase|nr:sugar phosphate isomerase/epimerase [Planctomicrobium sp.]